MSFNRKKSLIFLSNPTAGGSRSLFREVDRQQKIDNSPSYAAIYVTMEYV